MTNRQLLAGTACVSFMFTAAIGAGFHVWAEFAAGVALWFASLVWFLYELGNRP